MQNLRANVLEILIVLKRINQKYCIKFKKHKDVEVDWNVPKSILLKLHLEATHLLVRTFVGGCFKSHNSITKPQYELSVHFAFLYYYSYCVQNMNSFGISINSWKGSDSQLHSNLFSGQFITLPVLCINIVFVHLCLPKDVLSFVPCTSLGSQFF